MKKKIAIIGLGYVGLPLVIEFQKKFEIIGYDISSKRVNELNKNKDTNNEFNFRKKNFFKNTKFTNNEKFLKDCSYLIVTVPTPIDKNNIPDLSSLKQSCKTIGKNLKKQATVIFESTVYPGCTEEVCLPLIEKFSKKKINKGFFLGYSPERINVGDKKHNLANIKKIVSGSNKVTSKKIANLYSKIIQAGIHICPSIKVAEAAKAIENAQRDINIAFINEVTKIFYKLKINTNDVLDAASTKWNFLNFKPGMVGGHCIGVDPYYLTYKAKKIGFNPQVILSGRGTNDKMSSFLSKIFINELKKRKLGKKILILGLSFKENVSDVRNSKVFDLIKNFNFEKYDIDVFDPLSRIEKNQVKNFNFLKKLDFKRKYDGIFIAVGHNYFSKIGYKKIKKLGKNNCLILDFKNIFLEKSLKDSHSLKL